MPRKVFHGADYDYDYDNEYDIEVKENVPFKFNIPSPDLVSSGVRSMSLNSKGVETKIPVKPEFIESLDFSSASISKDRQSEMKEKKSTPHTKNNRTVSDATPISSKSGETDIMNEGSVSSISEYKHEKWMIPDKEANGLDQLNLAIIGHVDSGKSTLSGRLLHLLGRISKKEMHKYEKEAKQQGKGSFAYA